MKAYIASMGTYLPKKILTNAELEQMVNTSDEWIVSRTGMRERRIANEDEHTSMMGSEAAKVALQRAGMTPSDVDAIVVATLSPDYLFPSTACLVQHALGCTAPAFDIQAACTGLLYALSVAKAFVESGTYKRVLVVASEKVSALIDYQDRNTCVLFGDGAFACVVREGGPGLRIGKVLLGADGGQADLLRLPAGGSRHPASKETLEGREHYLKMDGKEIFKHAVRRMEMSCEETLRESGLNEVTYLVPHQANVRIIDAIAKRCGVPEERVVKKVDCFGNTSASSIGLCLDQMEIKDKDTLLLVAFGAGLTWGSVILTAEGM